MTSTLNSIDVAGGADGFEQLNVEAKTNAWTLSVDSSAAFDKTSSIDLGDHDDTVNLSKRLVANSLIVNSGGGNDQFNIQGVVGQIHSGAGNDSVHLDEQAKITDGLNLGSGKDTVTIAEGGYIAADLLFDPNNDGADTLISSGRIDGDVTFGDSDDSLQLVAPSLWVAPIGGDIAAGAGHDTLNLHGDKNSSDAATILVNKFHDFEKLTKTGSNVWGIESTNTVTFKDGLDIETGTLTSTGVSFVDTDVKINGTMDSKAGGVWNFDGTSNGVNVLNTDDGEMTAIVNLSAFDDSVENSGLISGSLSTGAGNDTLTNLGEINAQLNFGADSDTFDNKGSLLGSANLGTGNDIARINSDLSSGSIDGGADTDTLFLTGAGSNISAINKPGGRLLNFENVNVEDGDWTLSTTENLVNIIMNGKTLSLNEPTKLSGGMSVNSGTLTVNKTLDSADGTTVNSGAALVMNSDIKGNLNSAGDLYIAGDKNIGQVSLDGNISLTDGSRVFVDVNDQSNSADLLIVSGDLSISPNAEIVLTNSNDTRQSQEHTVVKVDGNLDGAFKVQNSGTSNYTVEYGQNGSINLVTASRYTLDDDDDGSDNENETGDAVDDLAPKAPATLKDALDDVADADYPNALNELNGEQYYHTLREQRAQVLTVNSAVFDRLSAHDFCGTLDDRAEENCRSLGEGNLDVWGEALASNRNYEHSLSSFDGPANSAGTIIGVDTAQWANSIIGAFVGYQYVDQETRLKNRASSNPVSMETDSHQLSTGAYARIPVLVANIDLTATYGHSFNNAKRNVSIVGTEKDKSSYSENLTAEFQSQHVASRVGIAQEYRTQGGFEFEPRVFASADMMLGGNMKETNADNLTCGTCLEVAWDNQINYGVGADIDIRQHLNVGSGLSITPYAKVGVSYGFDQQNLDIQNAFDLNIDKKFDIAGYEPVNHLEYRGGIGIAVETQTGVIGFGEYNAKYEAEVLDHQINAGVRTSF